MPSPSRSHVRIPMKGPIDNADRRLSSRSLVSLWIQNAASHYQWRIHAGMHLDTPGACRPQNPHSESPRGLGPTSLGRPHSEPPETTVNSGWKGARWQKPRTPSRRKKDPDSSSSETADDDDDFLKLDERPTALTRGNCPNHAPPCTMRTAHRHFTRRRWRTPTTTARSTQCSPTRSRYDQIHTPAP